MRKKIDKKKYCPVELREWWIDWYSRPEYYFCAVIVINDLQYYIERELLET